MCGYCIEALHLFTDNIHKEFSSSELNYMFAMSLQDCVNMPAALDLIASAQPETQIDAFAFEICCRALEVLITKGFPSAEYQSLMNRPIFLEAVELFTGEERRRRYQAEDTRFDLAAARWILDRQVFTEDGYLEERISRWTFSDGESLLKQYANFSLKGQGLKRNDLNQLLEETGMLDPIDDICCEDREALSDRFPAFWCALHWVGLQAGDDAALWEIVAKQPIGVVDFNAFVLWLQRRAALIIYDRSGFGKFEGDIPSIRLELFMYIALMRSISEDERKKLLDALNQSGVDDLRNESGVSLRLWMETGDLQLMSKDDISSSDAEEVSILLNTTECKGVPELELHSASLIASQIVADMECLYGRTISSGIGTPRSAEADHITSLLNGVRKGELLVVAVSDGRLREAFCLGVVRHVALQLRQSVAFCCTQESFPTFFHGLLSVEAGISPEENIYDGGLNEAAFLRLSAALVALKNASIMANQTGESSLEHIGALAKTHYEKMEGGGLILVDYIQSITDSNHCQVNPHAAIARLKNLARELMVPIIILHKLYPGPETDSVEKTSVQDDRIWQIPSFLRKNREYLKGSSVVVTIDGYLKQVVSEADTFLHLSGTFEKPVLVRVVVY